MTSYKIRYIFKKDGSQIAFWNTTPCVTALDAMTHVDRFVHTTISEVLSDTGWTTEKKNFWRRKITYAAATPEETNFCLHISVGTENDRKNSSY